MDAISPRNGGLIENTNGLYNCIDIDECDLEIDECSENSECKNTAGDYKCECNSGYTSVP